MPEYLAPGVYVEETSFRPKTIEGVSTSTAGFVGPTRFGPTSGEPELLTSFAAFEQIYGGLDPLELDGKETVNFLAHAARAFFEEGGKRLYISRVIKEGAKAAATKSPITLQARFEGRAGDMRVTFRPKLTGNLLIPDPSDNSKGKVLRIQEHDTVLVIDKGNPPSSSPPYALYDAVQEDGTLSLKKPDGTPFALDQSDIVDKCEIKLLTVDVDIERPIIHPKRPRERYETPPETLAGFSFHPKHANALTEYFKDKSLSRMMYLTVPFAIEFDADSPTSGVAMAEAFLGSDVSGRLGASEQVSQEYRLENGTDGSLPGPDDYKGSDDGKKKSGLLAFEDLEGISIVAAPGATYSDAENGNGTRVEAIQGHLISHCERMRYRIAVLDSGNENSITEALGHRSKMDSKHAAFYYPWVTIYDPITEDELNLPPSGFVAGIYARNDVERGVHKAPANEVVRMATGFEFVLNKAQQEALNPEGVNCFRFFEGRGYRLWGARTISSDPEWKFVNLRRYFAYLERSIDRGTQWVVFENNSEQLWASVRRTAEDFLFNEWKSGHLMGGNPQEAYFVRCDRSTMSQNDIDNGRLVCLVGVAPVRPAEFVIFRIGQWTADRRA